MSNGGDNVSANIQKAILTAIALVLLATAGYAAKSAIENSKDIAVNQTKIEGVEKALDSIQDTLSKIWERMNGR